MSPPLNPDARLLVVDDHQANLTLLRQLLTRWGYEDVTLELRSERVAGLVAAHRYDLVLLDLHMPEPDGYAVLAQLVALGEDAPGVIVLTADVTREARDRALGLGARDFLTKPLDPAEVRLRVANLLDAQRSHALLRGHAAQLEALVVQRTLELEEAHRDVVERLALVAEYRDDHTLQHARRVGRVAAAIASELGLPATEVDLLRRAAPLHDIGKIGIADEILNTPGPLTDAQRAEMQRHTLIGRDMLAGSPSSVLQLSGVVAVSHHERWDGGGYPFGLAGSAIPLAGRIVALADVLDALTSERPYKQAWSAPRAIEELRAGSGTHFDPEVVRAFDRACAKGVIGEAEAPGVLRAA